MGEMKTIMFQFNISIFTSFRRKAHEMQGLGTPRSITLNR